MLAVTGATIPAVVLVLSGYLVLPWLPPKPLAAPLTPPPEKATPSPTSK